MVQSSKLSNGIEILWDHRPWSKSISIVIGISVGSRHGAIAGEIYAAMQSLLQGTQHHTASEIYDQIEGVGGTLNISVERDLTLVRCHIPVGHVELGLKVLHELFSAYTLSTTSLQAIKNKMVARILARENNGMQKTIRIAYETCFSNSSFGLPILGSKESVNQIRLPQIEAILTRALSPPNLIMTIVGNYDPTTTQTLCAETFGTLASTERDPWEPDPLTLLPLSSSLTTPAISMAPDEKTQGHVILGIHSVSVTHPDYLSLVLLSHLLGGTMSSRLFTEIREIRGLAYTTFSNIVGLQDTGYMILYAGVRPDGLAESLQVFQDQLSVLTKDVVPIPELEQNRTHLLGQLRLAYELTDRASNWLIIQRIRRGRQYSIEDIKRDLAQVTAQDILRVSKTLVTTNRCNLTIVGAIPSDFMESKQVDQLQGGK